MDVDTGDTIARRADRALDLAVGALATWTVLFHLARLVGLGRDATFVLWVVSVVALGVVLARSGTGWSAPAGPGSAGRLSRLPVVLGLAAAALLALPRPHTTPPFPPMPSNDDQIDASYPRAGRRWRYQSSGRWTVTSALATQLARVCMRSPQRPAPRHQAAFRAAPDPRSVTSRLRRLRERSG